MHITNQTDLIKFKSQDDLDASVWKIFFKTLMARQEYEYSSWAHILKKINGQTHKNHEIGPTWVNWNNFLNPGPEREAY